jgi:His-Xaa-Ser system radical SAM maturase HxsB
MTTLHAPFGDRAAFSPPREYRLLPFRFTRFDDARYILTNDVGQYALLPREQLTAFVDRKLTPDDLTYKTLKARHFLFDDSSRAALDLLAVKYRTRVERLSWFTGLHIFVVTLRCDHSCHYCQVSRQMEDQVSFDMTREHAERALDFTFRSPSPNIKIEFQGGEALLNFELVRYIVERAELLNQTARKNLAFVIASNLSQLTDDVLEFCRTHRVQLSTSLDGPEDIHETQRPLRGGQSYATTTDAIRRARGALGPDGVSALMTTTPASLGRVEEIIDEYVRQEFHSIFLRTLSPYGFAARSLVRRYTVDDWVDFYKRGVAHILELNKRGYPMREELTTILLQKIFAPGGAPYVDLQSPAGIGIGAIVYNYDGAVYASDEGRMLAEMDDTSFRLGHLGSDSYEQVMTSDALLGPLRDTMLEGVPMCTDCAFLPYCGADPVYHRATQGDTVGHKAFSAFCSRQMALFRHVIGLVESDESVRDILLSWI